MKVLVLGAGFVGTAAGALLREAGHHVTVTTTTPAKVDDLAERFDDVVVLRGTDRDLVHAAVAEADAVVVTAGPQAQRAMTTEDRAATYDEVLVQTARSVVSAPGRGEGAPYVVALSALSVYGTAADGLEAATEDGPVTDSPDPSPTKFLEMERVYLDALGDSVCVFRCGDVFGPGDPPIADKVAMAHQYLGGSVPFAAGALFYRLHVDDAAAAVEHAVEHRISGVYNLTHPDLPPTNAALFDALSLAAGNPPLVYRDEIEAPAVPVSVAKLSATGFTATRSFDAPALR